MTFLVNSCCQSWLAELAIIDFLPGNGANPSRCEEGMTHPLQNKSSLDPRELSEYRPESNLPFLGRILEYAMVEIFGFLIQMNNFLSRPGAN